MFSTHQLLHLSEGRTLSCMQKTGFSIQGMHRVTRYKLTAATVDSHGYSVPGHRVPYGVWYCTTHWKMVSKKRMAAAASKAAGYASQAPNGYDFKIHGMQRSHQM